MSKRIIQEYGHIYDPEDSYKNIIQSIEQIRPQHMNNDESTYLLEQLKILTKKVQLAKVNKDINKILPDVKVIDIELLSRKSYTVSRMDEELIFSIGKVGDVDIYISNKEKVVKFYTSNTSKIIIGRGAPRDIYYINELPQYAIDILIFLCEYE